MLIIYLNHIFNIYHYFFFEFLDEKYCGMLDKVIGIIFFKIISSDELFDPEVRELCDRTTYLIKYIR